MAPVVQNQSVEGSVYGADYHLAAVSGGAGGPLYDASDGAEIAAQHLAASGATDRRVEMQEPGLYLHDVARELETLGDYAYALTRSGAHLSSD